MNAQPEQSEFEAIDAERAAAPVTAAFIGQSGSGKTLSALLFARGLVGPQGKIGVIDTEGQRAKIYARDPRLVTESQPTGFAHINFRAPWSSDRYRQALQSAIASNWHAIVIDSASHEHEAEGGMLDFADAEERRMVDRKDRSRAKWIRPKVAHNRFIQTAKSVPAHVIFCIREKKIMDTDVKPARELLEPVCERNMLFEMMLAIRLEPGTHKATFIKVPDPFLKHIRDGQVITVEHGALLMQEAGRGEREDPTVAKQRAALEELARDLGTDSVKHAWEATPNAIRKKLQPELERIKRIAADTDARLAAEEDEPTEAERARANLLHDGETRDEIPFDA